MNPVIANYHTRVALTTHGNPLLEFQNRLYAYRRISEYSQIKTHVCNNCNVGEIREDIIGDLYLHVACLPTCEARIELIMALKMSQAIVQVFANRNDQQRAVLYDEGRMLLEAQFPAAALYFPTFAVLKYRMSRALRRNLPPIPHTYEEIPLFNQFPETMRLKLNNDDMFLFLAEEYINPANNESQRILVFAADCDVEAMLADHTDTLWVDGTFTVCPAPFAQLVTILTSRSQGDS